MATTSRDFEFDRIEAFVKKHGATVLALQFPAHLLGEAPAVATAQVRGHLMPSAPRRRPDLGS